MVLDPSPPPLGSVLQYVAVCRRSVRYSYAKWLLVLQVTCTYPKETCNTQKRHVYTQKRHVYTKERHVYTHKTVSHLGIYKSDMWKATPSCPMYLRSNNVMHTNLIVLTQCAYVSHSGMCVCVSLWCAYVSHYGVCMCLTMVCVCVSLWCVHVSHYGVRMCLTMVCVCVSLWCVYVSHSGVCMCLTMVCVCVSLWCAYVSHSGVRMCLTLVCVCVSLWCAYLSHSGIYKSDMWIAIVSCPTYLRSNNVHITWLFVTWYVHLSFGSICPFRVYTHQTRDRQLPPIQCTWGPTTWCSPLKKLDYFKMYPSFLTRCMYLGSEVQQIEAARLVVRGRVVMCLIWANTCLFWVHTHLF